MNISVMVLLLESCIFCVLGVGYFLGLLLISSLLFLDDWQGLPWSDATAFLRFGTKC